VTDTVTVTFAAQTQNVALARSIAATMAARADLTLDRLEDLRLAVDEAVTEAIVAAAAEADITIVFTHTDDTLIIEVSVASERSDPPSPTSFGWTVLAALVDSATASVGQGRLTVSLRIAKDAVDA
jgi:serine/threonine-protein kinase RsbW